MNWILLTGLVWYHALPLPTPSPHVIAGRPQADAGRSSGGRPLGHPAPSGWLGEALTPIVKLVSGLIRIPLTVPSVGRDEAILESEIASSARKDGGLATPIINFSFNDRGSPCGAMTVSSSPLNQIEQDLKAQRFFAVSA